MNRNAAWLPGPVERESNPTRPDIAAQLSEKPDLALREIGCIERTLFTLDWIESPEQRRRATRKLNKGEAGNTLKRAIFFRRVGRLRDHNLQAQTHRASAVNVVVGAIVLWNTTYLQAALAALAKAGRPIPDEHRAHLSRSAGSTST